MSWTIFIIALNNVYSSNKKKKIENKKKFDFILNWSKRFSIRRVGLNYGGCLHTSGDICGHKTEHERATGIYWEDARDAAKIWITQQ